VREKKEEVERINGLRKDRLEMKEERKTEERQKGRSITPYSKQYAISDVIRR